MYQEDAIDFPCSPDWVGHYASLGLTRDYPTGHYYELWLAELRSQVESLGKRIESLAAEIQALKERHGGRHHR